MVKSKKINKIYNSMLLHPIYYIQSSSQEEELIFLYICRDYYK